MGRKRFLPEWAKSKTPLGSWQDFGPPQRHAVHGTGMGAMSRRRWKRKRAAAALQRLAALLSPHGVTPRAVAMVRPMLDLSARLYALRDGPVRRMDEVARKVATCNTCGGTGDENGKGSCSHCGGFGMDETSGKLSVAP